MIPGYNEPFPTRDPIVSLKTGKATESLVRWMEESLQLQVQAAPVRVQTAEQLPDISASGAGTLGGDQAAGLYRVTAYREVTVQDPVSSSLAIAIGWTHNGKALTRTLTAFAGAPQTILNTVGDVSVIEIDPGTPISYTLTYASNTPGLARFAATLSAELIQTIG